MKQLILLSMVLSAGLWGVGSLYGTKVQTETAEQACASLQEVVGDDTGYCPMGSNTSK